MGISEKKSNDSILKIKHYLSLMVGKKTGLSVVPSINILMVLYENIINLTPDTVESGAKDRVFLSSGYEPMALYAVMALLGFISPGMLKAYDKYGNKLKNHPDRNLFDCVEISGGYYGYGLSVAVGSVIASRTMDIRLKHWVLMEASELDKGANYEAITYSGRNSLSELNIILVDKDPDGLGWARGAGLHFFAEGWDVSYTDGHNRQSLYETFILSGFHKPRVIIVRI
ncbi:transketolase [Salmonella enterica subsp. enterica serovar Uzaramo]|nr:transketolase [Salmonella enterica subsp. enterica serovar Uzaramo]